ncbi:hypothetical protein EPA93_23470 [Ktedonosporobacter rubrisoli]|uniref:Uncharacterized protein n=1 Tax=Ktedonosporobacter rubrisoli TaxID=2509675 RepID=A0A4P6JTK9_KTERU|nr:hypothetical protein [Ktedonosporobacter rubrisoli]QBD78784.1 hypothetical protein EPA93_23470 [Ktedonosporobacter rubrisoli]
MYVHEKPTTDLPLVDNSGYSLRKGKLDLIILRYMAIKLYIMLHSPGVAEEQGLPWLYTLEERHARSHRIVIYGPQELLSSNELYFVGFVSCKRTPVDAHALHEMQRIDTKLLGEIAQVTDILSYSSLKLHADNWFNLVLLRSSYTRAQLKELATHRYASYALAPLYYEWIRLHNGILRASGAQPELRLQTTKYYTFPEGQAPTMRLFEHKMLAPASEFSFVEQERGKGSNE